REPLGAPLADTISFKPLAAKPWRRSSRPVAATNSSLEERLRTAEREPILISNISTGLLTGDEVMQQLTFLGPARLEWREAPAPELSTDDAALVRPLAVATCDLDALIVQGQSPFPAPFPIGHECVAEVLEVGDAVTRVRPGQRVSVPFQ